MAPKRVEDPFGSEETVIFYTLYLDLTGFGSKPQVGPTPVSLG